jgi:hypothetical protein
MDNESTTNDNGKPTRAAGAPKGNKNNIKHGYYSLIKLVRNRRGALDKRTILGKMVLETVNDLTTALGGDPSPQQRMLIEDVALDTLLLRSLNNIVATVQPLRKGKAHAAYQLRAQLISQRREHLRLLGLQRLARHVDVGPAAIEDRYKKKRLQEAQLAPTGADSSADTNEGTDE